jgi:hypothetical protein
MVHVYRTWLLDILLLLLLLLIIIQYFYVGTVINKSIRLLQLNICFIIVYRYDLLK